MTRSGWTSRLETRDEDGWAEFALPPTTLALGEENPKAPQTAGEGGATVALAVDDVETAIEELRDEDVPVLMDPVETGVCHMAVITDPDDNRIMLHKRNDGTHGRVDPFP